MANILFVGDLNQGTRSLQRSDTLKSLGHQVVSLSFVKVPYIQGVDKPSFFDRVLWKLKIPIDTTAINQKIIEQIKKTNFDVIWIDKGVMIYPWTLKKIRRYRPKIRIVSCSEDDMYAKHNQSLWYLKGLPLYDIVFTTKVYNLTELKDIGALKTELFLDSYDENLHKPAVLTGGDIQKYSASVGFIGSFEQDRAERMLFLAEQGIPVVIYGNGWKAWAHKSPNLIIKNKPLYDKEYVKAICATEINLCFLRKINRDQVTSRSVEIPACGAFMLGERTQRHLDFFQEGVEAEFFSSNAEMLAKVKFYLENKTKREEIAQNGLKRCIDSGYSMSAQLQRMMSITCELP